MAPAADITNQHFDNGYGHIYAHWLIIRSALNDTEIITPNPSFLRINNYFQVKANNSSLQIRGEWWILLGILKFHYIGFDM